LILAEAPLSRRSCMVFVLAPPRTITVNINTVLPVYTKKEVKVRELLY
jgi:hypothetical protein